jgi:DNA polymerase-1
MIDAVNAGLDLHDVTATNLFGAEFSKAQRKLAKNVGFGRVYGGGAGTLSRQAGVPLADAKRAMAGYDTAFPGIKRFSKRLQERAEHGKPQVITPAGRVLPMDRARTYTATNYIVQSTARDVLANAILELEAAGLGQYLLLPIHDEALCQVPTEHAAELAQQIADVMTVPFGALTLTAEAEVYGPSWGHGYGATT